MKSISSRASVAAAVAGAITVGLIAEQAAAHHSFAMYDRTKTVTLTGKLTRFIPGANHAQLIFEVIGPNGKPDVSADGKTVTWGVETGPAGAIARQGVTVESFPVGTVMTVSLNPLRDGRPFGVLADEGLIKCDTLPPEGGCTKETGEVFMAGD